MTVHSTIVHAAVHIPEGRQSVTAVEDRFRAGNPTHPLSRGVLQRMYGLAERTVADDLDQPSDLAVHAARDLLADTGTDPAGIDLLLYAGILADMEEPATAHVVADKLGLRCPVFDLKNACNGVLNALEVADAFIRAGQYRRVLVATAEVSTRESRWTVDDPADVSTALPSLSTGDMGSAVLVEASNRPGILGSRFFANSWGWQAATLPNPYAQHRHLGHLRIDSAPSDSAPSDGSAARQRRHLTVRLDRERCCSAGQCVGAAPEVFEQSERDGRVTLLVPEPDQRYAADVRLAADVCPSGAITLVDTP